MATYNKKYADYFFIILPSYDFLIDTFTPKAEAVLHTYDDLNVGRCKCERQSRCGESCLNGSMFYECDENNCELESGVCTNRKLEGAPQIRMMVGKTERCGDGLYTLDSIEPHQKIVEYTGQVLTIDECENGQWEDGQVSVYQ